MAAPQLMMIAELCFAPVRQRPAPVQAVRGARVTRQFWLFLVRSAKARQVPALRLRAGPCWFLVSRTRTAPGVVTTSTQLPPSLPL